MTDVAPTTRTDAPAGERVSRSGVEIRGVTKRFGAITALAAVDLSIPAGSFFGLLGPSGCGKTTLLRVIAGLEKPDAGSIELAGEDITGLPPEKRPFNIVFQRYALFPHLSVHENIAFGLTTKRSLRPPTAEIDARVREMLSLVGLERYAGRRPRQLSGGQQQRVAVARALIKRPELLLLDEPLAALDRNVRHSMREELLRIHAETGTTFLLVTHDQEEALSMSDRVALMRDGRFEQVSDPGTLYREPATRFAASFVGAGALVDATAVATGGGRVDVEIAGRRFSAIDGGAVAGASARVLLRPEDLRLAAAGQGVTTGTIETRAFFGSYYELRVETPAGTFRITSSEEREPGEQVSIDWGQRAGIAYPATD